MAEEKFGSEEKELDENIQIEFPGSNDSARTNPYKESVPAKYYQDTPRNQYWNTPQTQRKPLGSLIKDNNKSPGFFENYAHVFSKTNTPYMATELVGGLIPQNSLDDTIPEGWKVTPDDLTGFDERFWYSLKNATGPNDLEAKKQEIRNQMANDEYFSNGSFISSLAGGISGAALSPETYVGLGWLNIFKYGTVSKAALMTSMRAVPGMSLYAASSNALDQANRIGGTLEDAAYNTATDVVFGAALFGAGGAAKTYLNNLKLYNARKAFTLSTQKGILIDPVLDKAGRVTGEVNVRAAPGESLSAAEVDLGKAWYTEEFNRSGLFSIPGVGKALEKTMQIPGLQSPETKAAFNRFNSVKKFFNGVAGSSGFTRGEMEGIASIQSAENISLRYAARSHEFNEFYRTQFMAANGIDGDSAASKLKNFQQAITQNRQITHQEFGKEVLNILSNKDYKSKYSQAHATADYMNNLFEEMNDLISKHTGKAPFKDPRNAWRYFPIKDNIQEMVNRKPEWVSITKNAYKQQDEAITKLRGPIDSLKAQAKIHKKNRDKLDKSEKLYKEYDKEYRRVNRDLKQARKELNERLIEDEELGMLLEDRNPLDLAERESLRKILEPLKIAEKSENEEAIAEANRVLQDDVYLGKIDKKFYYMEEGKYKFLDPDKMPKLRAVHGTDEARKIEALSIWESKMNMSPNDITSSFFGHHSDNVMPPSHLKRRSHMVPTEDYVTAGFQDTDLPSLITGYMQVTGRDLAFKEVFPHHAKARDFESVLRGFKQEYDLEYAKIEKIKDKATQKKELAKLEVDARNAREFMKETYEVYFNKDDHRVPASAKAGLSILKNITSSALLGGVPLYQLFELGASMYKNTIYHTAKSAMRSTFKSIERLTMKGTPAEIDLNKSYAAHAALAINDVNNGIAMKWYNPSVLDQPPGNAALGTMLTASNKLSETSMNFFGTNWLANMNERVAAGAAQSRFMEIMQKYVSGTATKGEIADMAHFGIDLRRDAKKFLGLMEQAGGYKEGRAYQSMYFKWSDKEAVVNFGDALRKSVRETIVNSNRFSTPYWARNPYLSSIFMFNGWMYNSFNKLAVPLMQKAEAESILGATAMVSLNMMVQPMKRAMKGEAFIDDDEEWWRSVREGLENSGLLGPNWNLMAALNRASGDLLFESNEKRRGFSSVGAIAGPVWGNLYDQQSFLAHSLKGDATQGDVRKFIRTLPYSSHLIARKQIKKFVENSGYPEKRPKD